jgi:alkylation response protein AidB-like acyl-CoA dehydrogenase
MESSFIMNDEQRAILSTVARFVESEVKPRAAELDANQDPEKCFSWATVI